MAKPETRIIFKHIPLVQVNQALIANCDLQKTSCRTTYFGFWAGKNKRGTGVYTSVHEDSDLIFDEPREQKTRVSQEV